MDRAASATARPQTAPKRKKRTYNVRRVKRDLCYTIQEIAELFDVHPQAVRRWIKTGLQRIDDRRPIYIHGSDLVAYLSVQQFARKRACRANEFYCCRCRVPRRAEGDRIAIALQNQTKLNLVATCATCGSRMNRAGSVAQLPEYGNLFTVEATAPPRLDACVGPGVQRHFGKEHANGELQPRK